MNGYHKQKQVIIFCICLLLLVSLTSCKPRRPSKYKNSVWECENPHIVYYADTDNAILYLDNGDTKNLVIAIYNGGTVRIWDLDKLEESHKSGNYIYDDYLLINNCEYTLNRKIFTIYIGENSFDILFDGAYEKLVFKRTDLED